MGVSLKVQFYFDLTDNDVLGATAREPTICPERSRRRLAVLLLNQHPTIAHRKCFIIRATSPIRAIHIREYPRPQVARYRLLHPGLGHHGRRWLAGRDGRLASARR